MVATITSTAVGSSLTDWRFYAHRQCSTQLYVCADYGPLREPRIKEEDGVWLGSPWRSELQVHLRL